MSVSNELRSLMHNFPPYFLTSFLFLSFYVGEKIQDLPYGHVSRFERAHASNILEYLGMLPVLRLPQVCDHTVAPQSSYHL